MGEGRARAEGVEVREFRMQIVDTLRFVIGLVFLVIGVVMLVRARGTRGFGQNRQAGALFLVGGVIFVAMGFGFSFRNLF
jgi:drug/metabolite transporter (DMT)-like permease